jgi:hypothetical protein
MLFYTPHPFLALRKRLFCSGTVLALVACAGGL